MSAAMIFKGSPRSAEDRRVGMCDGCAACPVGVRFHGPGAVWLCRECDKMAAVQDLVALLKREPMAADLIEHRAVRLSVLERVLDPEDVSRCRWCLKVRVVSVGSRYDRAFCSQACKDAFYAVQEAPAPKAERPCEHCQAPLSSTHGRRFCSRECSLRAHAAAARAALPTHRTFTCDQCGQVFTKRRAGGPALRCSPKCVRAAVAAQKLARLQLLKLQQSNPTTTKRSA